MKQSLLAQFCEAWPKYYISKFGSDWRFFAIWLKMQTWHGSFLLEHSVCMDPKRPSYQHAARWTMQGLIEPFFNIVGCYNYRGEKSWGVLSFTGRGTIFRKLNDVCSYMMQHGSLWYRMCQTDLTCLYSECYRPRPIYTQKVHIWK